MEFVLIILLSLAGAMASAKPFHLILLHSNNVNFHFREDHHHMGGAGRVLHLLNKYRDQKKNGQGPSVLYLNAGDNFANIRSSSSDQWDMVAQYLNTMGPDAMCLGNHDLDVGLTNLTRFFEKLTVPVVGANINLGSVKIWKQYVRPSIVLDVDGRSVGIIGVTTSMSDIPHLPKGVTLEDELASVARESSILHEMGVDIIIVLSHSGLEVDTAIARAVDHVDVIVGGHRESDNQYRVSVRRGNGRFVPIVREEGDLSSLGVLNVYFNENGDVIKANGQPTLLHSKIPQAKSILELHNRFKRSDDDDELGRTRVPLTNICHNQECNYANLITDAMVYYMASQFELEKDTDDWTSHPIAIINSGVILRRINKGTIKRSDLTDSMNFHDYLVAIEIEGKDLQTALEQGLSTYNTRNSGFLQFSGLHIQYNLTMQYNYRIIRAYARCGDCRVPLYEPVKRETKYKVVLNKYISQAKNKDKVHAFGRIKTRTEINIKLGDVLEQYLTVYKSVTPEHSERLVILETAVRSTMLEPLLFAILVVLHLFLY